MTDHRKARTLAALAIDGALGEVDAEALRHHLASCSSCRRAEAGMRQDADMLRRLDAGDAPATVQARITHGVAALAATAPHPARTFVLVVGLLLLMAAMVGTLAVGAQLLEGPRKPLLADATERIRWTTDVVDLRADDFSIEVGGRTYVGGGQYRVHSDPGNATYRTLEVEWQEHGTPMRLYLYFRGNDTHWWVDEVRTYNGQDPSEWTTIRGPLLETPLGQPFIGDVLFRGARPTPAIVRLMGLRLAMHPADLVNAPIGGGIRLPEGARPFDPGGALHCSGILQLQPREAERRLLGLGYAISWRYVIDNGGYWEPRKEAPDGVIADYGVVPGTDGALIIPVLPLDDPNAKPVPFPSDCPRPSG